VQIGSRPKAPAVLTAANRGSGGAMCPIGHIRRALWRCKRGRQEKYGRIGPAVAPLRWLPLRLIARIEASPAGFGG
jgi:hypothetical protein